MMIVTNWIGPLTLRFDHDQGLCGSYYLPETAGCAVAVCALPDAVSMLTFLNRSILQERQGTGRRALRLEVTLYSID
jgi:hypothetical protein